MSKEVKEILENLDKIAKAEYYPEDLLTYKECQLLLDFITNLQEENERLQQRIEFKNTFNNFLNNKYRLRCEKAIEHIKEHQLIYTSQYEEESNFDNHLLDILYGGDE